jgi:hypothetical protein
MTVNSIDLLASCKVSKRLGTRTRKRHRGCKGVDSRRLPLPAGVEIVEPHNLALHEPPGGYPLGVRQLQNDLAPRAPAFGSVTK